VEGSSPQEKENILKPRILPYKEEKTAANLRILSEQKEMKRKHFQSGSTA